MTIRCYSIKYVENLKAENERLRKSNTRLHTNGAADGLKINEALARIAELEGALQLIASAANYTAPEDIEARLENEVKVYAIAKQALKEKT